MQAAALHLKGHGIEAPVKGTTRMSSSRGTDVHSEQSEVPLCSKCKREMKVVTSIAPTMNDPGLTAYECPKCGHLSSVIDRRRDDQC
jgi:DNA-directed RNA polymerase subunit RPC12/RpoP